MGLSEAVRDELLRNARAHAERLPVRFEHAGKQAAQDRAMAHAGVVQSAADNHCKATTQRARLYWLVP